VKKEQLVKLFNKYNKKYFENKLSGTKINIVRMSQEKCDSYAYYFPCPSTIHVYHWLLRDYTNNTIICTLLHEMVHAHFKEKLLDMEKNPLVNVIDYHDFEFAKKLYSIYEKEFSGIKLAQNMNEEIWYIKAEESNMTEALKYYGIQRYEEGRNKRILQTKVRPQ